MLTTKFRAWHRGQQKMYENICVMFCPNEPRKYRIFESSDGELIGNDKHFDTPMPFTGLYDKNGKEIYGGDIVRDIDNYHGISEVFMKNGSWKMNGRVSAVGIGSWSKKTLEIIGNVYKNPELLN